MIGLIAYYANQDSPEPPADDPTSQSPTDTGSPGPEPDAADMEAFVGDYLSTADEDPATAFDMLTPEFQAASGGEAGYTTFWDRVTNAQLVEVEANADDPDNLTVTYTYTFNLRGEGKQTDTPTLRLVLEDGGYLIADEL